MTRDRACKVCGSLTDDGTVNSVAVTSLAGATEHYFELAPLCGDCAIMVIDNINTLVSAHRTNRDEAQHGE